MGIPTSDIAFTLSVKAIQTAKKGSLNMKPFLPLLIDPSRKASR